MKTFRAVLNRAAASGLGTQPFASPLERLLFWVQRVIAVGSILLMGFLLPGLFIIVGLIWREPIAAIGGLIVLGLSTFLTAMLRSGQSRLKRRFQTLAGLTGLTCRQSPDVIPGLYRLSLAGEIRGRYVSVDFENHEAGYGEYWQGKRFPKRRQYLVMRARCSHPGAKGRFKPLKLTAARDAGEVAALLTPALLSWLTETHHRDELMAGAGAIGFRRDAQMTPEGFEQVRADILLAVELAEQLERQAELAQSQR